MSEPNCNALLGRLEHWLRQAGPVAVAVSGGVDSLTLGIVATRVLGAEANCFHALSPAVPAQATARVWHLAAAENWRLTLLDAGEFSDANYRENPLHRCYFCKSHLYAAVAGRHAGRVLSGTNTDDLKDNRPGLKAAAEHGVQHPFLDCGLDKQAVRALCSHLGYPAIAALPASPCLSSRVQTGLRIEAPTLGFIDRVERMLRAELPADSIRCRILKDAVCVQLDAHSLAALGQQDRAGWTAKIAALSEPLGLPEQIRFEPYRMGSAFVDVA